MQKNLSDSHPVAGDRRPRVTEPCAPYDASPPPVSHWAVVRRLDTGTLQEMAAMLAIVNPRHFETILRRGPA